MEKGHYQKQRQLSRRRRKIAIAVSIIVFIALLVSMILVAALGEEDNFARRFFELLRDILFVVIGLGILGVVSMFFKPAGGSEAKKMISCQSCGYFGAKGTARSGACPRCGSTRISNIETKQEMISCQSCGYFGAKTTSRSGACPRCGSARITSKRNW